MSDQPANHDPAHATLAGRLVWAGVLMAAVVATSGTIVAAVGALDKWAVRSATGATLLSAGLAAAATGAALVAIGRPRSAARAAGRRGSAWRAIAIVVVGVWPFVTFATFIGWRIGVATEQRDACEAGDAAACRTLAVRKDRRGKTDEAHALFDAGCRLGEPFCCASLAARAPADTPEAALYGWLETGCQGGVAPACVRLARAEAERDPARAARLFDAACDLGDASACDEGQLLR